MLAPIGVLVDGVRLDSLAWNITTRTGWDVLPGKVGGNARVPGRDGSLWRAKDYDESSMVLELFVLGCEEDGSLPIGSDAEEEYRRNLDALFAIFGKRHGLLEIVKEQGDGSKRVNYGEVTAAITPEVSGGFAPGGLMKVEITFPDPLWKDYAGAVTVEPAGSATLPRTIRLDALAGSTAPIHDATVLVVGPITNPVLTDQGSGASISYTGTVAAGSVWRIVAGSAAKSETGTGLGYTGGTVTNQITQTTISPGPRFLPLTPRPADGLAPSVTLSGSGASSATTVKVQATRRFLA